MSSDLEKIVEKYIDEIELFKKDFVNYKSHETFIGEKKLRLVFFFYPFESLCKVYIEGEPVSIEGEPVSIEVEPNFDISAK